MAVSYGTYTITEVQEGSQIWTTTVAPVSPDYTFTISNLTGDSDTSVKVGDVIMYSYYRYTVLSISDDETTVLTGNRVSIRGATGASSVTYTLIVSNLAIIKDKDGNLSPSSITVTAKSQTGSNAMANYTGRIKIETTTDNSTWTSRINEDAATKTYTIPSDTVAIRCSLYLKGGTATLLDQQTIPIVSDGADGTNGTNGADAYTVILTNENHTFTGNTTSALASEIECNVIAYKGATQVASTIGTITGQPTGMTTSLLNNGTVNSVFKVTVTTSMVTRNGVLSIPITVDGKTFTKEFTYALTLDGEKGDKGETAQWYYGESLIHTSGTATLPVSQTEDVAVGAMYLNTKTGICYKCTTISGTNATWTYAGNITDGIEVGGRNYLKGSDVTNTKLTGSMIGGTVTQTIPSGTVITLSVQVDADDVVWGSSGNKRIGVASSIPKDSGGTQYIEAWAAMTGRTGTGIDKTFDTSFHGRVKSTYTLQGELPLDKAFYLYVQSVTSGTISVSRPKLEIGNKATDWTPAPEDIIVGKNLIPLSKNLKSFTPENLTRSIVAYTDDSCTITNTYGDTRYGVYYDIDVESGLTYTLSFQASNVFGTNINYGVGNRTPDQTASWNTITGGYKDVVNGSNVCTFTIPDTVTKIRIYFGAGSLNGTMTIGNLKLEVGNRATEWTSAPEDIQYAMKVANNYLSMDETGIMVADMNNGEQTPSEATGNNVFIDNTSVNIRDGQTTLASFGVDGMQIGLSDESHTNQDYHSWQMIDKEGNTYVNISDLRDATGVATVTEKDVSLTTVNNQTFIDLSFKVSSIISVTINDTPVDSFSIANASLGYISTTPVPVEGDSIIVVYTSSSAYLKAYSLGIRKDNTDIGAFSFVEGYNNTASGHYSHAEGNNSLASGTCSHAEGYSRARDVASHAEGHSDATGKYSHAEGSSIAQGMYSHAEGDSSNAVGVNSHAENASYAGGFNSHAEGKSTEAMGDYSHAEGYDCTAQNDYSHAEGCSTTAGGAYSHAQNLGTQAGSKAQTAIGQYNVYDGVGNYAFIIGNGVDDSNRSNALTVKWDGTITAANGFSTANTDLTISRVISTTYMNNTQFNRIKVYKKYGMLHLLFNAEFTSAGYNASSDFQTIATISGWQTKYDTIMAIPNQTDGTKVLMLQITYNGNIKVYSTKAISGWYRTSVCVPSVT